MAGLSLANRLLGSTGLSSGGRLSAGTGLYFGGFAFSPASLFAAGEQGVWYDPSDLTTLFQDSAGTTPVTAVEQPVGRMLDLSGRGNHATQSTSAARPVLSARVNVLTKTEQFNDAAWAKTGMTAVANAAIAPDGTLTADAVSTGGAVPNSAYTIQNTTNTTGVFKVYAKQNTARYFVLVRGAYASGDYAIFDLQSGTVTTAPTFSGSSASISSSADGWYLCTLNSAQSATINAYSVSGASSGLTTGTAGSVYIWGADLRVANAGVGLPAYQRVNTTTDYDTVGFPLYLRFDGVDDTLVSSSIPFAGANTVCFCATQHNGGTIWVDVWRASDPSNGYWAVGASGSTALPHQVTGVGSPVYSVNQVALSPVTRGRLYTLQINATTIVTTTGLVLATDALRISGYVGSFINGCLYSLIVCGATLTAQQISNTETWINGKAKAY